MRWPPVARSPRAFALIAWLALAPILLLVPSIAGLVASCQGRGPQTLLPSAEAAYPWALALFATGRLRRAGHRRAGAWATRSLRRRRLAGRDRAGAGGHAVGGHVFTAAAVVNELSLGDRPAISSRFGPTDPTLEPPPCDGPLTDRHHGLADAPHGQLGRRVD